MVGSLVACLLLQGVFGTPQDSPRLRTLLANGSSTLVETMPEARTLSVQLFAGVRGVPETRATHGWRHVLEHLILRGKDGKLDERLEGQGVFFTGRTYRDAMQIEFTAKPDKLNLILEAIDEILAAPIPKSEEIAKEIGIMRQEEAFQGDFARLSRTAWQAAFEDAGLDPFGDLETMAKATPEHLSELKSKHFAPPNLSLVVCGNVDKVKTTAVLRAFLEDREGPEVVANPPRKGEPGRREAEDAFGEVRAALVNGVEQAGPTLCAAFAIAARLENAGVTYTPTTGRGLVLVSRTDANNTIGVSIDELTEADEAALFPIARLMAERWLSSQLATPAGCAYFRGMLMAQSGSARPEDLRDAIRLTSWSAFREGIGRFRRDKGVTAVGIRP